MRHTFEIDGKAYAVWLARASKDYRLEIDNGRDASVALMEMRMGVGHLTIDAVSERVVYAVDGDIVHIQLAGRSYAVRYIDPLVTLSADANDSGHNIARAPMPGVMISVKVAVGDRVAAGAVVAVIESMKLETAIRASQDGIVEKIHVKDGESFDRDAALVALAQREV